MPTRGRGRSLCPGRSRSRETSTSTSPTRTTSGSPWSPAYIFTPPPGADETAARARGPTTRPRRGQNLVATLSGWIDEHGRARLAARSLPRDPVTLGLLRSAGSSSRRRASATCWGFATSRSVTWTSRRSTLSCSGDRTSCSCRRGHPDPEPVRGFAGTGRRAPARRDRVPQRSGGPRAGHRECRPTGAEQAAADRRPAPTGAGRRRKARSSSRSTSQNAQARGHDHHVAVRSTTRENCEVRTGRGTVTWCRPASGTLRVRVEVTGLDGTAVSDSTTLPGAERSPDGATGRSTRARGRRSSPYGSRSGSGTRVDGSAKVSTLSGIVFTRRYVIRNGTGVVDVDARGAGPGRAPDPGPRTAGSDRDRRGCGSRSRPARKRSSSDRDARPGAGDRTVGAPSEFAFAADGCRAAVARHRGPGTGLASGGSRARRAGRRSPGRRQPRPLTAHGHRAGGGGTTSRLTTVVLTSEDPMTARASPSVGGHARGGGHLASRPACAVVGVVVRTTSARSFRCSSRWSASGSA